MLPSAPPQDPLKAPESHRFPDAFRGYKSEQGAAMCQKSNEYKTYQSSLSHTNSKFNVIMLSSISSPVLFRPKSMIILSISSMFLHEKTDFLLIEFFNLNFRFPLGSENAKFIISGFSFVTS